MSNSEPYLEPSKAQESLSVRYVRAEAELYAAKNLREEKEKKLGICLKVWLKLISASHARNTAMS